MSESASKYKPLDQSTLKARFALSQCKVQQSFRKPHKIFPYTFLTLLYIQCLKYSVDVYSNTWFGQQRQIFSYIDLSTYTKSIYLETACIGLFYFLFSVILVFFEKHVNRFAIFVAWKVMQIGFGTIFFTFIIGGCTTAIKLYFIDKKNQKILDLVAVILAILSILLFSCTIMLQTFTRFDFIVIKTMGDTIRTANLTHVTLLLYILINQVTSQLAVDSGNQAHLIIMSIAFVLHIFLFVLKSEHAEDVSYRVELSGIVVNVIAIVLLLTIKLVGLQFDFGLFVIFSIISVFSISQVQFFNIAFELQNVNKWTNSQIMMSYASKLRKIRTHFKQYFYNTLYLGYVQIHQQKCDNQTCPLRATALDQNTKILRFQDIIKKIYNDGCKMSPVNPQLLLQYAIFHYETGAKQKSLKLLLQINENQLSLDKYYKFLRLRRLIHREISEIPNQDFLDLLSEIQVNDLEEKITKKFEQAALISLEFWSILNQDHPDFRKLYEVGKNKVIISEQIHKLYKQINKIAFSQRVTSLYIHYLNQIENQQKIYTDIEHQLKNETNFEQKIIIEDWTNNCNPVMIVSIQQQRYGTIIDLNTTCATMLGYEKFDLLGREIKTIFPGVLSSQIQTFMGNQVSKVSDQEFFVGQCNGYVLRLYRKLQPFNSIQTGISLVINIEQKFVQNFGFLIFNNERKLFSMSSSCLQLLSLDDNILESQNNYDNIFSLPIKTLTSQKTVVKFQSLMKYDQQIQKSEQKQEKAQNSQNKYNDRFFNICRKKLPQFEVIEVNMIKSSKTPEKADLHTKNFLTVANQMQSFSFQIINQKSQFTFLGGTFKKSSEHTLQNLIVPAQNSQPIQNERLKNYAQNITTLRLHQNYIKVIEESEQQNQEGDTKSQTSTNNQFITKTIQVSKADQQRIFQSRQTYHDFIDQHIKKIYIRIGLCIAMLICVGIYIGLYFGIKSTYNQVFWYYNRLALGNQIVGQISEANRIVLQTQYRAKSPSPSTDYILLENYNQTLQYLQRLMGNYSLPYMLDVYINSNNTAQFQSDQFILNFISQFSKVRSYVQSVGLSNITLDSNSSWFIQTNSMFTKPVMYQHTENFKEVTRRYSRNAVNFVIFFNIGGVIISLILTILLLWALKKINEYKTEILCIFLETTEKDIQAYSEKTQNFLITLHVDESNENNNEPAEDMFENKKNSSAMFAKRKRFKTTQFPKAPYLVLASFFFFSSAYYIHLFSYSLQKDIFIVDAIQYINLASNYSDIYSTSQAKIYKQLTKQYAKPSPVSNNSLISQINSNILAYERDFFIWHYKTYGFIDEYHQKFATVFMRDICNGEIKIKYACDSGIMASNGTLLMMTETTVLNEQIDFSKPLDQINPDYYTTIQAIKQAHLYLLAQVLNVSSNYFNQVFSNVLMITIVWALSLFFLGFLIELYIQKTVVADNELVKKMLKFIPVAVARHSEGVHDFVAAILEQQTF